MIPEAQSAPEQLGSEMNFEQWTQTQQSAAQSSPVVERIIIHHLSDLRYRDRTEQRERLFRYRGYLDNLTADRRPTLVVITGDLTESGKQEDLRAVANILATCFPDWANKLNEHIFVIPGVRDVNWETTGGIGWQAFLNSFKEFALPSYPARSPGSGSPGADTSAYVGYAVCTCYPPDELSSRLKDEITLYSDQYTNFTKLRRRLRPNANVLRRLFSGAQKRDEQVGTKTRGDLDTARALFLQLTEDRQPLALDSGRVLKADLDTFEAWSKAFTPSGPNEPLKILITHHPLAVEMDQTTQRTQSRPEEQSFKTLAEKASHAGFSLALHGHIHSHSHTPKALSGISILSGSQGGNPLRQVGAASLCDTGMFNEIIAERLNETIEQKPETTADQSPAGQPPTTQPEIERQNGQPHNGRPHTGQAQNGQPEQTKQPGQEPQNAQAEANSNHAWRFELRLINVDVKSEAANPPFLLLNPKESAERLRKRLEETAETRQNFEARMRVAMRQFSERVQQSQVDNRAGGVSLPQSSMQVIEAIVRDLIFNGCAVRVRVLLKDDSEHRPFSRLTAAYLTPPIFEGPDTLVYPASVAAWSIVLGRTLHFPDILKFRTDNSDHEWLRSTNKLAPLRQALEALKQELFARSAPNDSMRRQYDNLINTLKQLESGSKTVFISGSDIFQNSLDGGERRTYPEFICVPYPLRPRGGAMPTLPETMALDVGVRRIGIPTPGQGEQESIFTADRTAMLESIAELIGMMLTTANALGKPRGLWDPRTRG